MEKYLFTDESRAAIECLKIPFAIYQFINKRVVTLVLSDGFLDLFGYKDRTQAYDDMDNNMYVNTHPDDVVRIANEALRFATEGGSYDVLYRTRTFDDPSYKIIHASGKHVYTKDGVRLAHVWYADEGEYTKDPCIDEAGLNKTMSSALYGETLLRASQYDYLTGLPRMAYFFELAEAGKNEIEKSGARGVMLFFDLNGMKFFNSRYGFAEGDKLLKDVSRVLVSNFSNENCCHIGGDHFAVYTSEDGLEERLNRIVESVKLVNNGNSLPVRIGIYIKDIDEDVSVSTAIDRAKYACDAIRDIYNSTLNYFRTDMLDKAYLRQYVVTNLDRALENKWIQVYYQPIVRAIHGRACDEEALARWIDPERGFLSPPDFIPFLEAAGILYKLDLYVLERVLEKIKAFMELGASVVPQSINLSRSDFDACDMVEEIRRRVDDAGISRKLISIEITESVIGSDFEYIKEQILRFRELGFPVWMDDFGSGYSSLDMLQELPFDLIKFDMNFMHMLNKGEKGKIILTELMKMVTFLNIDTVCEGVETSEQVRFLQEIGCSKLQGFYFQKPTSCETLIQRAKVGFKVGYEDPREEDYYNSVGRINLYDLAFVKKNDKNTSFNLFNTIPMSVLEVDNDKTRYIRCNESYRYFMKKSFDIDLSDLATEYPLNPDGEGTVFMKKLKECCVNESGEFLDEELPDGSVIHAFLRKIGTNPITGRVAVATAVLSITEPSDGTSYADIARALALDYYNIYYVDLTTDQFIEYSSHAGTNDLVIERRGDDFFELSRQDAMTHIYERDRELFISGFTKENVLKTLDEHGAYTATYRLIDSGEPLYASMKCTRMPDKNHIIVGISIVDSEMKQKEHYKQLQLERETMIRVMALSEGYLSIFTIDPETDHYTEYSSTDDFNSLGAAKEGDDFFSQAIIDSTKYFHPDDVPGFKESFTKERILRDIHEKRSYKIHYRLMINGKPMPVSLLIASFKDKDTEKLVAGIKAE